MKEIGSREVVSAIRICAVVWVASLGLSFLEINHKVTDILMNISVAAAIIGIVLLVIILPAVGLFGAKDKINGK